MILYFTGTGNSRYAAETIGAATGDEVVSMNDWIKSGKPGSFESDTPYVFVCPTYAWRIPRVVERFLRAAEFSGSKYAYFVLTCGSDTGDAGSYAERLCKDKGFTFMGLGTVVMPENYIAIYSAPEQAEALAIIRRADPQILALAENVLAGRPFSAGRVSLSGKFSSSVFNPVFYRFVVSAKGFYATDGCIGCGKCAELCPLNNIGIADGRPQWGSTCTHCMACICGCPKAAIEYKNHSRGKPRYFNREKPTGL